MNATVLVVDDEPAICWAFERMLRGEGHDVLTAASAEEGLRLAKKHSIDLVILDVRLPNEDGITALPKFLAATDNVPVVIVTAFGDLETAVAAVKSGAADYLTKPFKLEDALRICRTCLRTALRSTVPVATQAMKDEKSLLVGKSQAMQLVFRQIALVADSDLSVLITGETGTGKELVTAAIHRHSRRADKPYIALAPVALNPDLIESELFGHVKGAFTGATENRAGLFEQADGGTVALDEIGDLPLSLQVKLLRVLERGEYFRVGEFTPRRAKVRILAATHRDLQYECRAGRFREDLFHRLAGVQIHLPPLRQRMEDVGPLCRHFLEAMNYAAGEDAIDDALLVELQKRDWHGNIRELKNAVAHAAVVARGRPLSIGDFPKQAPALNPGRTSGHSSATIEQAVREWAEQQLGAEETASESLHTELLSVIEPVLFQIVLDHTGGNRAQAAKRLGIHRGTLRDRLKLYRVD